MKIKTFYSVLIIFFITIFAGTFFTAEGSNFDPVFSNGQQQNSQQSQSSDEYDPVLQNKNTDRDNASANTGNNPDKLTICHNDRTIEIDRSAWSDHKEHGDQQGSCTDNKLDKQAKEVADKAGETGRTYAQYIYDKVQKFIGAGDMQEVEEGVRAVDDKGWVSWMFDTTIGKLLFLAIVILIISGFAAFLADILWTLSLSAIVILAILYVLTIV